MPKVSKVYNVYPDRPESNKMQKDKSSFILRKVFTTNTFQGQKIFSAHFEHKFIDKGLIQSSSNS